MSPEEPLQQAALGGLRKLLPVQVWGAHPVWSKYIQVLEALSFNHLGEKMEAMFSAGPRTRLNRSTGTWHLGSRALVSNRSG